MLIALDADRRRCSPLNPSGECLGQGQCGVCRKNRKKVGELYVICRKLKVTGSVFGNRDGRNNVLYTAY